MNASRIAGRIALSLILLGAGAAGGYFWAQRGAMPASSASSAAAPAAAERKVLYWYDPMVPQQHFDKPGKSPFMDMELVPKYADEGGDAGSVRIDPAVTQNLGMRLATVTRESRAETLEATGVIAFNERDVAVVQARAAGFVERVHPYAPDDTVPAGATLAEVRVPGWSGAQEEFLLLKKSGDAALVEAARSRMRQLGMPAALIEAVEKHGVPQPVVALRFPTGGVLRELELRTGMTVMPGQTLARVNGLGTVWLEVAVPESQAALARPGQRVEATLPAFPGETITGRVSDVLPDASLDTRTLRLRIVLPNPRLRLRPGMTAQVRLHAPDQAPSLWLPSEAVIRGGRHDLVMLAEDGGRFRPVEIRVGRETGGKSEVLDGLAEGQTVVASGQFLIDSEASLKGIVASAALATDAPAQPVLHESEGRIVEIGKDAATIAHGPFKTLGMPGMTMSFALARPDLAQGIRAGDRVRFAVREADDGLVIERLEKTGGAQ